jgi:hypothetical protein
MRSNTVGHYSAEAIARRRKISDLIRTDPLTEVLRSGARALLAQAVEAEVSALLSLHTDKLTYVLRGAGHARSANRCCLRPGT